MNWINIKDDLPPINDKEDYLVLDSNGDMFVAYLSGILNDWEIRCECNERSSNFWVTHWMELPKRPKD